MVIPSFASAASKRISCELTATTSAGEATSKKELEVVSEKGKEVTIAWDSTNASKALSGKKSVETSGEETVSPTRTTTYKYTFSGDGSRKKTTCEVTVHVASGDFDRSALSTSNSRPTLSGSATGTKKVQVIVRTEGSTRPIFSKNVSVKRGEWKVKSPKTLTDGTYHVELLGEKGWDLNTLSEATLTIGDEAVSSTSNSGVSSLSVSSVPLLFGGTATRGASVPVAYLKVTNTGKVATTFSGVTLKQRGTAAVSAITSLEVRDDKGMSRGIMHAKTGSNNSVSAATNAEIGAGQTRLFTVRAVVSPTAMIGSSLMLDLESLASNSKILGTFPLRGTTYTIR